MFVPNVGMYESTRRHNPEEHRHPHCSENFKFHSVKIVALILLRPFPSRHFQRTDSRVLYIESFHPYDLLPFRTVCAKKAPEPNFHPPSPNSQKSCLMEMDRNVCHRETPEPDAKT
jgi:hypothetical protein